MLIVTGGAGFIGSNLVRELNAHGITDILVVDHTAGSGKEKNLQDCRITAYLDKSEFRRAFNQDALNAGPIDAILHQGACSNTLENDEAYMMDNNFEYSKELLAFATRHGIPLVYASTAAVYGLSGPGHFTPTVENERPLNIYGASKLAFDNHVRPRLAAGEIPTTVVGLRYFNVYGPREWHKGRMASVIHHFTRQIKEQGKVSLFKGTGGYGDGEQRRDFVFVRDLAHINMFFAQLGPYASAPGAARKIYQGVVNAGTGASRTFNEVAHALMQIHGDAKIDYIPFPADLEGRYQHFTEADISGLRELGYKAEMAGFEEGIAQTFTELRELANPVR